MTMIQPGDKAPSFKGKDQNGDTRSLQDFLGKKLVIYFYPKDDTPGCTKQACNLRDHYSILQEKGIQILGVSADDQESHKKFEQKYQLPFPLIADTDKKIIEKYGVWGERNLYGKKFMGIKRTSFLINENGKVDHIIRGVRSGEHAEQILKVWGL